MTKRLIHVIVIFILVFVTAAGYLAAITLPVKIHDIVIGELEKAIGKKIFVRSLNFNLFSGLVLENAVVYDSSVIYVWAKSASCGIPFSSITGSSMAIPSVTINSPAIYIDRRPDGSFNLSEFIQNSYNPNAAVVGIGRFVVKNGRAIFIDRSLTPIFKERIDDISADVNISLPDKISLNLAFSIPSKSPMYFKFAGIYLLSSRELAGRTTVKGLSLNGFKEYYQSAGIRFPKGDIDADINTSLKDNELELDISGRADGLSIVKDKLNIKADSLINMMFRYDITAKTVEYAGKFDVQRMDIDGIDGIGKLENIKALVEFDDSRLWSENVVAEACGIMWNARINIFNFNSPVIDIYADSDARLGAVQDMLKNEFRIIIPTEMSGKADINLAIQVQPGMPVNINGYAMLRGATMSMGSGNFPIEGVMGELQFNLNGAKWSKVKLRYRDEPYITSGELVNFADPKIKMDLASKDLSLKSVFSVNKTITKISQLEGRYLGSAFYLSGDMDTKANKVMTTVSGALNIDLKDLKKIFKNSAALQKLKLSGKSKVEFGIKGDIKNFKTCSMRTRVKSDLIYAYGIKLSDVIIDYVQTAGAGQVKSLRAGIYGGSLYGSGKIDWTSKALPYNFNIDTKDVKLEALKKDMGFKDKDVSGDLKALAGLSGTLKDTTKFSGTGRVSIANGRLWQLNLFKGVGSLIFPDDFNDIVFTEGSSDVKMSHKGFVVNNFILKSDLLNLYGSGTIGMDRSVNATIRPEIKEDSMGSGTHERIAMAVSSNTVIKITGTVSKPEYKTQANFGDVVGGIAGAIFQQGT